MCFPNHIINPGGLMVFYILRRAGCLPSEGGSARLKAARQNPAFYC